MNRLPEYIKQALRKKHAYMAKAREQDKIIEGFFNKEGISIDHFTATDDLVFVDPEASTEALTFIDYGEGHIEDNIEEIEKVYLYYKDHKTEE